MTLIETKDGKKMIPISEFEVCKLDGKTRSEITKEFPTRKGGAYYLDKFNNFLLKNHHITLVEYIKLYLLDYPRCPDSGEFLNFKIRGVGLIFSNFKQGCGLSKLTNEKFKRHCETMSQARKGSANPMFGKVPWNKGDENFAEKMRQRRLGSIASETTKKKQSESAKNRKIHGHTGKKHSPETIDKLREITSKRFQNGTFSRETSIHIKVREFLKSLELCASFEEEFHLKYFSLDFAFPELKFAIECQGTYFHIDPRFYPNGPQGSIQKRNYGRDIAKKKFLDSRGWTMLELWETEINNREFEKILICKLQELNLLKKSE